MSSEMDTTETGAGAGSPAIFPLSRETAEPFVTHQTYSFGWSVDRKGDSPTFYLAQNSRVSGANKILRRFPLDERGWNDLVAEADRRSQGLVDAISGRLRENERVRVAAQNREAAKAELEASGIRHKLPAVSLLGGYGYDAELEPGSPLDLYFTEEGVWITKTDNWRGRIRVPYPDAVALEFTGPGVVKKGGRFIGGGFGLAGAAEGMVVAAVLNSLTARSSIQTMIRLQAKTLEVFVFCSTITPGDLRIQLSDILSRIAVPSTSSSMEVARPSVDFTDRLLKLGEMFERGLLSEDEFATAKARLLA